MGGGLCGVVGAARNVCAETGENQRGRQNDVRCKCLGGGRRGGGREGETQMYWCI